MNKKKIFMIIILIVFITGIYVLLANANKKSLEKNNEKIDIANNNEEESNVSNLLETTVKKEDGIVRKKTENLTADTNNILDIKDNFFIEQTNDIYYNLNDYLGKTIRIEGFISNYKDNNGDICYAVIRNTPGCCGNDGVAGLDIRYDKEYPELKKWVEIIGVIGKDISYDSEIPAIQVTSIKEKEEGKSFVTN